MGTVAVAPCACLDSRHQDELVMTAPVFSAQSTLTKSKLSESGPRAPYNFVSSRCKKPCKRKDDSGSSSHTWSGSEDIADHVCSSETGDDVSRGDSMLRHDNTSSSLASLATTASDAAFAEKYAFDGGTSPSWGTSHIDYESLSNNMRDRDDALPTIPHEWDTAHMSEEVEQASALDSLSSGSSSASVLEPPRSSHSSLPSRTSSGGLRERRNLMALSVDVKKAQIAGRRPLRTSKCQECKEVNVAKELTMVHKAAELTMKHKAAIKEQVQHSARATRATLSGIRNLWR